MAIAEYQNEKGETVFKVSVSVRSQKSKEIRVQKSKFALKTLKEAKREEGNLLRLCSQEVVRRESQGSSWGALVEQWREHLMLNASMNEETLRDTMRSIEIHTESWWRRSAAEILKVDVEAVLNQMQANGSSSGYIAVIKDRIQRIFRFGIERRLILGVTSCPTYGISIKRREYRKPEILTLDQIRRLLEVAKELPSPWYPIWAMALLTGMRNGELYALTWGDIDWENGEISVTKSYSTRHKRIKSTKSGDWRVVPISSELSALLLSLKPSEASPDASVLPRLADWTRGGQAKALRTFCMGLGLPSIKFHTLRACFATQLIRSGVAPIRIQKICGWKDLETMQRYIRLSGIETKGATEGLKVLPDCSVMDQAGVLFSEERGSDVATVKDAG